MKKGLSTALTSLIILSLTIASSTYLLAVFTPWFGSITITKAPQPYSEINLISIQEGLSSVEMLLYNNGLMSWKVDEVVFDNVSVPFTVKFANLTESYDKMILPKSLTILVVSVPLVGYEVIYLKSEGKTLTFYKI